MRRFPSGGLLGKVENAMEQLRQFHIPNHAAGACYFLVLSLFPALVLVLSLLRYTTLTVTDLLELLDGVVPDVLLPSVSRLITNTYDSASGMLVGFSALAALWSASRGVSGLVLGLDDIFQLEKRRNYFHARFISVVYTFLLLLVLLLTLVLHVFGNTILSLLHPENNRLMHFLTEVLDLRFFLLLFVQMALFTAMYMFLPSRRCKFRDSVPGAALSAIGWLVFSDVFSKYVENFDKYANVYGSVYTVAISMLWLYFCLSILFYGGVLNRFLSRGRDGDA